MKVFIFLSILALVLTTSRAEQRLCPDGKECSNGVCCETSPLFRTYWCCRGALTCRKIFGFGICFLYSEEKPENLSLSTTTEMVNSQESYYDEDDHSDEDSRETDEHLRDSDEASPEHQELTEDAVAKMAFAEALLDILKGKEESRYRS